MTDLDVAVIGGGVAGLTAAYRLRGSGRAVRVFEAADVVGGRMTTLRQDGYVIDVGAEQVPSRGYPCTWQLLGELGVEYADVPRIRHGIAMWRGRARPGVTRARGVVTGAGLSLRARFELAALLHRRTPTPDMTITQLCRGDLLDYLLEPIVAGFFGWDPARTAARPVLELLRSAGSTATWRTYREGMDTFARALAEHVDVRTSSPVRRVSREGPAVRIHCGGAEFTAGSVVLAVPAPVARRLYPEHGSAFLDACSFSSVVKVHLLLDRPLGRRDYAVLVPEAENGTISTIMFDHLKHPGRVPAGRGLVTVMAHPRVVPHLFDASDDEIAARLTAAAEPLVPGLGAATTGAVVSRLRHALPEVTPKALALRGSFAAERGGPVDYAGDWVLLNPCSEAAVLSGLQAAQRLARRKEPV